MENYNFIYKNKDTYTVGEIFEGKLVAYEENLENSLMNNIYRARIKKYLKAMDAYILDIGEDKDCLLRSRDREKDLRIGQDILVEIRRLGQDDKMHEASQKLSLRGKYLILTPLAKKSSYSKGLKEEKIRLIKEGLGFNYKTRFRTASNQASLEDIAREYEELEKLMDKILLEENRLPSPKLIYKSNDLGKYIDNSRGRILTNDKDLAKEYGLDYDKDFNPDYSSLIQMELSKFHDKYIYFKNTAFLILDQLETLTVIDINQGSEYLTRDKEDMSFMVNRDGVDTICQALRLLEIKKMVVIDFIRMNEYNRRTIKKMMEDALDRYGIEARVLGFSKMGLFELIVN